MYNQRQQDTNHTPWFSAEICRKAMRAAIASSSFGAISVGLMNNSSIIVLYAALLGAGRFMTLFTTAVQPLSLFVLVLPAAYLMEHTGRKRIMVPALCVATAAYLGVAASGFLQVGATWLMLLSLSLFASMMSIYTAGWMPLLHGVVPDGEKGRFFGSQRSAIQIVITAFLLLTVFVIGTDASLLTVQLIFAGAALLVLGRLYFMRKIPDIPGNGATKSFTAIISGVIRNRPLIRFSVYLFLLYLVAYSTIPVVFVFTKLQIQVPDNYLVLLTLCVHGGSICGYYLAGRISDRFSIKHLLLICQILFAALNLSMLTIHSFSPQSAVAIAGIIFLYGAAKASVFICARSGMFSLLKMDNINLSIAVWYAIQAAGSSISRILSGLLLNSAFLRENIHVGRFVYTKYHVIFALAGLLLVLGIVGSMVIRRATVKKVRIFAGYRKTGKL